MRALLTLIVVCVIAATGVHATAAAPGRASALAARRAVAVLRARVAEGLGPGRRTPPMSSPSPASSAAGPSAVSGSAMGPGGRTDAVAPMVIVEQLALTPPAPRRAGSIAGRAPAVMARSLSTCSARGPPV